MLARNSKGFSYLAYEALDAIPGFVHAFTTRQTELCLGGAQRLGPRSPCEVFLEALELPDHRLILLQQEHSDRVVVIKNSAGGPPVENRRGDAIVLTTPGWHSAICTADCLPVVAVAPRHRVVSLIHAGWRGSCKRVVSKAVSRLLQLTGAAPEDLLVGFGPCIRRCCYKVGEEVRHAYRAQGHNTDAFFDDGFLDLAHANKLALERMGIGQILDSGVCTSCRVDLFYSYRREKTSERMWTMAGFRN